ncbi:MAG: patatin-like phospholipase family protein [Cyclobacteriaceae bacterium]
MQALRHLFFSLPVQLLIRHIKRNQFILGAWILIILAITQNFGRVYGIPYLFLDPEYLDEVNFMSFFVVGLTFGGLITAFHITSYILYSTRYAFIGVVKKPFSKFSVNNSVIPLIVLIVYIISIIRFQVDNEYATAWDVVEMTGGFCWGVIFNISLLYLYFRWTNKDVFKYLTAEVDKTMKKTGFNRQRALDNLKKSKKRKHLVQYYLDLRLKVQQTKSLYQFYDKHAVLRVFDQNHFNSVVIDTVLIGLILLLRFFIDIPFFQIPAAASILLLLTVFVMAAGAVVYWFGRWSMAFAISMFFIFNALMKSGVLNAVYEAPGLEYEEAKAEYSIENLKVQNSAERVTRDKENTYQMLQNWKNKWPADQKPKMILLCASGGGQRAALWTFNSLLHADSVLNGKLLDHTVLMTGASGGAIGATYFRELKTAQGEFNKSVALGNISRDNLNPVIFSLVVNDLVLRNQFYEYEGNRYLKDRGYAFESQLNRNTAFVLNRRLIEYQEAEKKAEIPMLLLGPTISLDGRKMYISSQPVSYMNTMDYGSGGNILFKNSGIDFLSFFKDQGSENLNLLTALRMNASFPYVTPNVKLPSDPAIELMDSGVSDNFGISDALKFMYNFKDWIAENTKGVILLSIRDTRKEATIDEKSNLSILERISVPISSVYNNLTNYQDLNNDNKLAFAREWFDSELDLIGIEYNTYSIFEERKFINRSQEVWQKELERASLSWHLTKKEKMNIIRNINQPNNQAALKRLKRLIQNDTIR